MECVLFFEVLCLVPSPRVRWLTGFYNSNSWEIWPPWAPAVRGTYPSPHIIKNKRNLAGSSLCDRQHGSLIKIKWNLKRKYEYISFVISCLKERFIQQWLRICVDTWHIKYALCMTIKSPGKEQRINRKKDFI